MTSSPVFRVAMEDWYQSRVGGLPHDVDLELTKPTEEYALEYAAIGLSSPSRLGGAEVWGDGTVEVWALTLGTDFDPTISIHKMSDPEELSPILDRLLQPFTDQTAED